MFRVVQPWGPDKGRQATIISEHPTTEDAFEALERIARQAERTSGRIEAIERIVVDGYGRILARPDFH
jgi:hypothetical protein